MNKSYFSAALMTILLAAAMGPSCNGDDGPDPAEVCPSICQKEADCDLLGTTTYDACVAECLGFADNMLDDYLEALAACTEEKTCAELTAGVTAQGICYEENEALCTTNTDDWVEAACLTSLSCDGIDDPTPQQLQECMDRMHGDGNILICFEPSVIANLTTCVESATECNPSPIPHCALEVVGLELGNSGHNP
ncbi:MAG: hypothetical protein ABI333_15585 [bacterium]